MARRRPPLVARMGPHTTSIFGEMSRLATELGAVNLGQGFPDTDGPEALKNAAIAAINDGRGNQYPPVNGLPQLRSAITAHQARFYGISLDPDTDVVVTTGASEAIAASVLALIEPDDEVVVFEPWFDVYDAVIALARGIRVGVPMNVDGLRPNLERLAEAITSRTRVILLNSPHNPTGMVFTREELQVVADLAIKHDLIVISDEAYEHLWFDANAHVPIATLPGMHERTITVGSGGKTFSFTGWKVGWASGPQDLITAVRTVRQHLSYVSGGPFQWALLTGLQLPDEYFTEFRADLAGRRDLLCKGLEDLGFAVVWPQGTYFATTDVRSMGYENGLD
ncbi:MAG: aminotransferase class I/II-fold pyridoxal phosphate-dependent enzyme, partial [Candidatus Nanopelagicales bacterium]